MTLPLVACPECCYLTECPVCLALEHEGCDREDCLYCRREAERREAERYVDAQIEYYRPGGVFDNLMGGMEI